MGREIAPLLVKVRRSGSGWVGSVQVGRVKAVKVSLGRARLVLVSHGGRGMVCHGTVKAGRSGFGMLRSGGVSFGEVRRSGRGPIWSGQSRRSRHGRVRWVVADQGGQGGVGRGAVR